MYVWRIYDTLVDQKERFGVWYMLPFLHGTICRAIDRHREIQPELVMCGRVDQLLQAPLHTHNAKHTSPEIYIQDHTHIHTHTVQNTQCI